MRKKLLTASAAMAMLVGCAPGAPATEPTVAPTARAVATEVAPTVQAVATQVAPTAQAVATQVAGTPAAQAVGTVTALSPVQIAGIDVEANDVQITLRNTSANQFDLGDFRLRVGQELVTLPTNVMVMPGETITIHTGRGTTTGDEIFLGDEAAQVMDNLRPGAQVALLNDQGTVVAEFTIPTARA